MALTIETPAGKMNAPAHIARKYAEMSDTELFGEVDQAPFVDPFALGEIRRRDKLAAYYRWCDDRADWSR